jgi:DNA-binding NtrC family response regulator
MSQTKGKVLCVDDEANILRSLKWMLQKDFDVHTAISGQAGLMLVAEHDFDVVISDQRMPGMMGSEFLREVRTRSPRSMRILLTGYSDLQAILRSVNESEVFRFISKPWKIDELPGVVAEAALIAQTRPAPAPVAEVKENDIVPSSSVETVLLVDDDSLIFDMLRRELGEQVRVSFAHDLGEAVAAFDREEVGVIIAETRVKGVDMTRMLKLLKQEKPAIVTVVITDKTDAEEVIGLINQGQVYRFIPKPVIPAMLKIVVNAARAKRAQLRDAPEAAHRHAVDKMTEEARGLLTKDIEHAAATSASHAGSSGSGFMERVAGGLGNLFGGR